MNGTIIDVAATGFAPTKPQVSLFEALDLISSTTFSGALWGISFGLYILCARAVRPQLKEAHHRRNIKFTFAYTSVVIACDTILLATTAWLTQQAFIGHADFPGGPSEFENQNLYSEPTGVAHMTFSVIIDVLTLGIQLWRLWVVWASSRWAVFVMIPCVLVSLAFVAKLSVVDLISNLLLPFLPDLYPPERRSTVFAAVLVLQLVITVLITLLIIVRLMLIRRRHINLMGEESDVSKQYTSIAAMLIESYALESAWSLAGMVAYFLKSQAISALFLDCEVHIKVVAYLLVLYRVSSGRGWNRRAERQISTLHWDHGRELTVSSTEVATTMSVMFPDATRVESTLVPTISHSAV
ncbi:hypothetical protein P691DRAFT_672312 [Macrolepiota fuliginosa MF-IS2]|uniref:Uncharacterized protein n=1 Tax=Macrolepiota fuliginosa MF-IS2 TaxID=1400762 RepID=A0A9P5X9Q4_9AGAR|nr:hypothetical protein P691DRAFT_672312 [Macrolepiota fuliginosa MF-IS2]